MSGKTKSTLREALRLLATRRFAAADSKCIEIVPSLFLGSIGAASNLEELQLHGISHILCAAKGIEPKFPEKFKYLVLNLADKGASRLEAHLDKCFSFIDEALQLSNVADENKMKRNGILVHCFQGKSRSVAIVVAYLMKKHNLSFLDALERVREKRPIAQPNPGFAAQLLRYEKNIKK